MKFLHLGVGHRVEIPEHAKRLCSRLGSETQPRDVSYRAAQGGLGFRVKDVHFGAWGRGVSFSSMSPPKP